MHAADGGLAKGSTPRTARVLLIAGFACAGVLNLADAALSQSIVRIPLSVDLGLLQLLPPTYWFGLGLIVLSTLLAMRERSDALLVATGMLLLAAFAGTPSLFEPNPRYWDAYLHLSEAQPIQSTGFVPAQNIGQYSANWPGSFLLIAIVSHASGVPAISLLMIYPFVTGALTFAAMFIFLRSTFSRSVAGPGAILASFAAVWAQFHLSPQSLGFVLLLLVLATIWRRETRMRMINAGLFVGLVVSHPTSTLILLCILIVTSTLGLFWGARSPPAKEDARYARRVTLTYGTTWLAWLYFHATSSSEVAETAILSRMGSLVSLPEETLNLATSRTAENLFTWAPLLRLGSLAVFGLGVLVALLLLRRDERSRPLARFLFSALIGVGLIGGADILGFGGQFYDRCLLLFATLAPAICLTGLEKIRPRKWVHVGVVLVLVGASAAAASTAYYQEVFNLVPGESIAIAQFLERVPPESLVVDGQYPQPVWLDPLDRTPLISISFQLIYPASIGDFGGSFTTYAVFDQTAELWYLQWRGIDIIRLYQADQVNHSRIYDNGHGSIYRVGG